MAVTDVNIDKVAGSDGNALTLSQAATFTVPTGALAGKTAAYTSSAVLDYKQRQTQANMTFARLLSADVQGGKLDNSTSAAMQVVQGAGTPVTASIYQLDSIVRRAPSLQLTADARQEVAP